MAYALWQRLLRYDPQDPLWLARDRFILSNGHASMLLYAVLHLAGVRSLDPSGTVREETAVARRVPWMVGGAADLATSTRAPRLRAPRGV